MRDLHERSRSSWFLFWRSASFRKEFADVCEEAQKLEADVNVGVPFE